MNKTIQIVRMTKDPELAYTQSGTAYCNFSAVHNKKYKGEEQSSFFNYVAWGKTAELICQYVKKGQQIGIESEAMQDTWEDKTGNKRSSIKFNVREITFISSGKKADTSSLGKEESGQTKFDDIPANSPFNPDDIPF